MALPVAPLLLFNPLQVAADSVHVNAGPPGFDRCGAPSTAEMNTWYSNSPYDDYGFYFGGENNDGCSNVDGGGTVDNSWIATVQAQGWDFLPLWNGLQPPCTQISGVATFSLDPTTAWNQGVSEAQSAYNAFVTTSGLDLGTPGIAYLNIDAYTYTSPTDACDTALINFIGAWDNELHSLGSAAGSSFTAGVYGSMNLAYTEWYYVNNGVNFQAPDDIWMSNWPCKTDANYCSYFGGGQNGVYNFNPTYIGSSIPDSAWYYDQRIWQYNGPHSENYGPPPGVALTIDSDCVDASVLGPSQHNIAMNCGYPYR